MRRKKKLMSKMFQNQELLLVSISFRESKFTFLQEAALMGLATVDFHSKLFYAM